MTTYQQHLIETIIFLEGLYFSLFKSVALDWMFPCFGPILKYSCLNIPIYLTCFFVTVKNGLIKSS